MVINPVAYMRVPMLEHLNLLIFIALFAKVNDPVIVWMPIIQEVCNCLRIIPIHLLDGIAGRVAHGNDAWRDVRHVQVEAILLEPLPFSGSD